MKQARYFNIRNRYYENIHNVQINKKNLNW